MRARHGSASAVCAALIAVGSATSVTNAQAQTPLLAKTKPLYGKVASPITALYNGFSAAKAQRRTFSVGSVAGSQNLQTNATGVAAEIAVTGSTATARAQLEKLGVTVTGEYKQHFDALVPFALIDDVALIPGVSYVAPNYGAITNVGAVTTQGDRAMRADLARTAGSIDGTGQKVGILSDTFDFGGVGSYAADQTSGDLPADVQVVAEYTSSGKDEGRAMMQIVHDVAPGAKLAFATAFGGQATMAANIGKLRTAGCTVITDDVSYLTAPFFMDGIVAQAVNQCVNAGVPYFMAAGNQGTNSYESSYSPTTVTSIAGTAGSFNVQDFDPGAGVDTMQQVTIPAGRTLRLTFQWDDQWKSLVPAGSGATNDFDMYLLNSTGTAILASAAASNMGGDPVELLGYTNSTGADLTANILIMRYAGTGTPRIKYVNFDAGTTID